MSAPYYSSKPKANEVWRFEKSHCGGRAALTTPSDKVCPSSPFPGKSLRKWNTATETRRLPTREHHKQHPHPNPRCVSPSSHLHQFRHDLPQQAIPELNPDSWTLLAHIHKKFFFKGTWRLIEMAKWVLAEPRADTVSAWGEVISSHFSQIFHGIATLDYQLLDLQALFIFYVLIINLMKLSASNDISMIFLGTVEERNSKFPHFKTLHSLTCLHTNALKFYSLLLNFGKVTIQYGNYEEIPTWKENYGEFTYVLRYLTKYSWWIHLPPSASIILHSWFK